MNVVGEQQDNDDDACSLREKIMVMRLQTLFLGTTRIILVKTVITEEVKATSTMILVVSAEMAVVLG